MQGDAFGRGESVDAIKRFTPSDVSGVEFIKLADGRGWVPVTLTNGVGSSPFGW